MHKQDTWSFNKMISYSKTTEMNLNIEKHVKE